MKIEQQIEIIKPTSTDTKPQLYKLVLIATGNHQEIEWLKKQLERVSRVELPVILQNTEDFIKEFADRFIEWEYQQGIKKSWVIGEAGRNPNIIIDWIRQRASIGVLSK